MAYDLRLDVPARAYINVQLLALIERGGSLFDAKKKLFSHEPYVQQGLDPYSYSIYDQSAVLSVLFCTIVVPREFLALASDHQIYKDFDTQRIISYFTTVTPEKLSSYQFIRNLRNSVAHGLFSVTEKSGHIEYEFWTDREPTFRARVSQENLLQFIELAGSRLANATLAKK